MQAQICGPVKDSMPIIDETQRHKLRLSSISSLLTKSRVAIFPALELTRHESPAFTTISWLFLISVLHMLYYYMLAQQNQSEVPDRE